MYIMEYYLAIKKEWNLAICDTLEGPRGHYAKDSRNKAETESQILVDDIYMWNW